MAQPNPPHLAPPGSPLPLLNRLVLRWYVKPFVASRSTWDEHRQTFQSIDRKIERELVGLNVHQLAQQILVPPLRGLEDSSRFWSIAMTLEHLLIVGSLIRDTIIELSHDREAPHKKGVKDVKPLGQTPPEQVVREFYQFQKSVMQELDEKVGLSLRSKTYPHDWFGPMNAHEWHWLLAVHSSIHLRQIREIRKLQSPHSLQGPHHRA